MKKHVGIDLGTTNSTISLAFLNTQQEINTRTLQVKQIDESGENFTFQTTLPSVLYISEQNTRYVGLYAKKMISKFPKQVIRESKRVIGTSKKWIVQEQEIRPEEVAANILKVLRNEAEKYYGEPVNEAVITVPANFNFQRKNATVAAASLAGFDANRVYTLAEPTAALLDFIYEEKKLDDSHRRIQLTDTYKNLLVVDLGGGTCDVSILQVKEQEDGQLTIHEVSVSQYMELGGYDFDKQVANYLMSKLMKSMQMTPQQFVKLYDSSIVVNLSEQALHMAELAKKHFALEIEAATVQNGTTYYDEPEKYDDLTYTRNFTGLPSEIPSQMHITKKEYDTIIATYLYAAKSRDGRNIESTIDGALRSSMVPLEKEQIDGIFLVGGMTLYPTVAYRVYEIFDKRIQPIVSLNPLEVVSRGAAIYHYHLDKIFVQQMEAVELTYQPIVPENIYVETVHGEPILLVEKGTTGPITKVFENEFYIAGTPDIEYAHAMELELFEAEEPNGMTKRKLHAAMILFKNPISIGTRVIISVHVSPAAEISVKAWVEGHESEVLDVEIQDYKYTVDEFEQVQKRLETINQL